MITRPERQAPQSDDRFVRVLDAVNSHRTPRPARRARAVEPGPALGAHLLAVVRAQDAAIPADRRAPRTVAEMRARLTALTEDEQDACGLCGYWQCRCAQGRAQMTGTAVA
ncbi:hypothetical protein [Streptomyces echinatus]|uniref:Uncharacterized protein n=1 Tax=Streptomyces echinatus TaxID=67293 RepID=A0A7W9Q2S8_9ACTN|nr:hypothetical protein [Streptomyces echinatus]MBB5932576.1 hypothetical protein [Streptomyces echinatus]